MKKCISIICMLLCSMMLLTACAGGKPSATTETPAGTQTPSQSPAAAELVGKPWINADLYGNLPETAPRAEDNFHMAVNYEWLKSTQIPAGEVYTSAFTELDAQRKQEITALIDDKAVNSHEAQLVRTLYEATVDMDARNEQDVEPLTPYIESIKSVKSISELTALLTSGNNLVADPLCVLSVDVDDKNSMAYVVRIAPISLTLRDADLYGEQSDDAISKKAINDKSYLKILQKFGYTADEAKKMNDDAFAVETQLATGILGSSAKASADYREMIYNARTLDELRAESKTFPLAQILSANGYGGSEKYILNEPKWLEALNKVYTDENLEGLKALMIYNLSAKTIYYMSQDFVDLYNEKVSEWYGVSGEKSLTDIAYENCTKYLPAAMGKIYIDGYFDESIKKDVEAIIEQIRKALKARLSAAEWLTNEMREKALEKLDAIAVHVGYPDIWTDYSALELKSAQEGGSLLDNVISIDEFESQLAKQKIGTSVQRGEWKELYAYDVNAFYNEKDNSINIPAGILGGAFYSKSGSQEQNLGGIGAIIGHEFTHAFDTIGGQYDKNGNLLNWWTDADRAAFKERTDKVAAYYSSIELMPELNVNGELTICEAVADLGGMSCIMDIAKGIDGFDYKAFFEASAQIWRKLGTESFCVMFTQTDEHPLGYVRTNVTLQQLQEFYDAFGIKEGDGMYLAPESRLAVW